MALFRSVLICIAALGVLVPTLVAAEPAANRAFLNTWERTDRPVAAGQVSRTWMWGPEAFTGPLMEPYSESPGGHREIQYYDKSRMEITHPDGDPTSVWYVTNGLLVMELVTGRLQLGDNQFEQHEPAGINVAGDAGDTNGPTYATLAAVLDAPPGEIGSLITQRIDRDGVVTDDPALAERDIRASNLITETNHLIADPFLGVRDIGRAGLHRRAVQRSAALQLAVLRDRVPDHRAVLGDGRCRRAAA